MVTAKFLVLLQAVSTAVCFALSSPYSLFYIANNRDSSILPELFLHPSYSLFAI